MNLAMPALLFALIRNGLAMGQYYHKACREKRKPALTARSLPVAKTDFDPAKPPDPAVRRSSGGACLRAPFMHRRITAVGSQRPTLGELPTEFDASERLRRPRHMSCSSDRTDDGGFGR